MNDVVTLQARVPAMSDHFIAQLNAVQVRLSTLPQVAMATHHVLHGGSYTRTIKLDAGVFIISALIKRPTTIIVCGDVTVNLGESVVRLTGYNVLPASGKRKQAFQAHADTYITMTFATNASTIEEAEKEFTDDADQLMSRHSNAVNEIIITGE